MIYINIIIYIFITILTTSCIELPKEERVVRLDAAAVSVPVVPDVFKQLRQVAFNHYGLIDGSTYNYNILSDGDVGYNGPPVVIGSNYALSLYNRGDRLVFPTATALYAHRIYSNSVFAPLTSLLSSATAITKLDRTVSTTFYSVKNPLLRKDTNENVMAVSLAKQANNASFTEPLAFRFDRTAQLWSRFQRLENDLTHNVSVVAEPAYTSRETVLLWVHNNLLRYRLYTTSTGWQNAATTTGLSGDSVQNTGVDIDFDQYDNGYLVYHHSDGVNDDIRVGRVGRTWPSMIPLPTDAARFLSVDNQATASPFGYPKVFVGSRGDAHVFFLRPPTAITGADLYYTSTPATSSRALGAFSAAERIDEDYGDSLRSVVTQSPSARIKPFFLAKATNQAMLLFIKSDGSTTSPTQRLYGLKYNATTYAFESVGQIDLGAASDDVVDASVAINDAGQAIVAWVARDDSNSGRYKVHARQYSGSSWSEVYDLSSYITDSSVSSSELLPTTSINAAGEAMVGFSCYDQALGYRRTAVGFFY